MALEALLPSEIARLIYGYLIEEKCIETAKTFLNESPNLQECRSVMSQGKHFTTRVCGYGLWDILEKFCIINCIVQEKIDKFDNTDKLRHCCDLINKIKLLVEEYKGHKFFKNIVTTPTQHQSMVTSESSIKSHRRHTSSIKDETKLKQKEEMFDKGFKTQIQKNFDSTQTNSKTETTLLKNLPGYIKDLQTEKCETLKLSSPKKSREISKIENILQSEELNENIILQEIKNQNQHLPDQRCKSLNKNIITNIEENLNKYIDSEVQTFERFNSMLDKSTMTNNTEENLKNNKYSEVQTLNICSNDFQVSPTDECIELLSDLTLELLNHTEIQEIIADNINRILEPVKSNLYGKSDEVSKEELNKSFIIEFNKAIEVAVNKTENDPEFLDLLNEIIPKNEEILSTENQIELNNRNVNKFQKVELVSKEKVARNSSDIKAISSKMIDQSTSYVLDIQNTNKIMNIEHTDLSNMNKCIIESTEFKQVDLIKKNSKIPVSDVRNNLLNPEQFIKSQFIDLNPLESRILQQKSVHKSNNLFSNDNNITSTPIKTSASIQNLDTYDWFSTQELLKPNILYQKGDIAIPSKTNAYTACETIVTTMASHLSPIISKETAEVAERITTISYLSTNAIKEQTLQTPETHSPKMKLSNSISFPINIVSKYKAPFSQKSSEVLDELLNFHTSQKLNGNINNLSPLVKDNNEYNRYFSIESTMLYGIDNNISTIKTPLIIPEIEVEDAITLMGTGPSALLKIHKKTTETTDYYLNEKNEGKVNYLENRESGELKPSVEKNEILKNCITKKSNESHIIVEKNSKELFTNVSQLIMKNTSKKILENKSKINRLSLSTPKKASNYIRALNFNTPVNRSYSEGKMKNKQFNISPEIMKINLKNSCKSSLFQSPPFLNSDIIEQKQCSDIFQKIVLDSKNLIPINKEIYKMDGTNEYNKKNSNQLSKEKSFCKKNNIDKLIEHDKKVIKKKVWDSDLRKCLGQYEIKNKNYSPKRNHKKKTKKQTCKKITRKIKKKNSKPIKSKQLKKCTISKKLEKKEFKSTDNAKKFSIKKTVVETQISKDKNFQTAKQLLDILSENINNYEIFNEVNGLKLPSEEVKNLTIINNNIKIGMDQTVKETVMEILPNKSVPGDDLESKQIDENIKQSLSEYKNLMDYKKIEEQLSIITNTNIKDNCTKKVEVIYDQVSKVERGKLVQKKYARLKTLDKNITKSSFTMDKKRSSLSDFALELETLQKDEITLQVPPTPQIMSPGSSSLMMPISKSNEDSRTIQSLVATPLECPLTPKIVLTPPKIVTNLLKGSEKPINSSYYEPTLNTFGISKKSEITQFEVIKENLLNNKHVKTESNIKNVDDNVIKLNASILYREKEINLKSDSSSNYSASSYNCESYSSSNKEDNLDMQKNADKDEIKKSKDIGNNGEPSPMKVFIINKPYEEINDYLTETSLKNENMCTKVDILESSSVSKVIDTSMNLNPKISNIMLQEQETTKVQRSKVKIITKSPIQLIEALPSNIQMNTLEIKKNTNALTTHRIKIEKSDEEVAKAVQSITNQEEKINKNQNTSTESIIFDSSFKNDSKSIENKLELVKAIDSITKANYETQQYSFFKPTNSNNKSDSEANLELILKDENIPEIPSIEINKIKERPIQNYISPHQHNTRFKSRQMADEKKVLLSNNNALSNCNIPCQQIQYIFDEDNFKRKRRKVFSNAELTWEFHDEHGNLMNATAPTHLDIIFQINPARKRTLKQPKTIKKEKFLYTENIIKKSMISYSNNNNPILDTNNITYNEKEINKINTKRKRTMESENVPNNRKRKKNIFIL